MVADTAVTTAVRATVPPPYSTATAAAVTPPGDKDVMAAIGDAPPTPHPSTEERRDTNNYVARGIPVRAVDTKKREIPRLEILR